MAFFSGKVLYLLRKIQVRCQGRKGLQSFPFPIIIFYCLCYLFYFMWTRKTMHSEQRFFFFLKKKEYAIVLKCIFSSTLDRLLGLTTILNQILKETYLLYATCGSTGKVKAYLENLGWSCRQLIGWLQSPAEPLTNSSHTHKLNYAGLVNNCLRSI